MSATNTSEPADQAVESALTEKPQVARGRLKVFLGYAPGVGKSFRMLDEGRRRRQRGQDVVVGAIQPKVSSEAGQALAALDTIPLKQIDGCLVMDVAGILARNPQVCVVDGLAYDNPPGSRHATRWQDVEELLDHGITVVTSVNLQHIEEKRARVEAITHKPVTQTVPLSFVQTADEIVVVDAPPESSMMIAEEGSPSAPQRLTQLELSELREIALLLAADVVEKQLERYLAQHGIQQLWGTHERILVYMSPQANVKRMLESGVRNRDRFHGELLVAYPKLSQSPRQIIEEGLQLAQQAGAEIIALDSDDPVDAILRLARRRGITQIYVGHKGRESWRERAFGSDLDRLIRCAEGIDVRVFPDA